MGCCATVWEQLEKTTGLVPYPTEAVGWALRLSGFSGLITIWLEMVTIFSNK